MIEIINIIRNSQTSEVAKNELMNNYGFIRSTGPSYPRYAVSSVDWPRTRKKIEDEYQKLMAAIADYKDILAHRERINQIIYDELMEIQKRFEDERRTELQVGDITNIEDERPN